MIAWILASFVIIGTSLVAQLVISRDVAVLVEDLETGGPLAGAEVHLSQGDVLRASGLTDSKGFAKFHQDCRLNCRFDVQLVGFTSESDFVMHLSDEEPATGPNGARVVRMIRVAEVSGVVRGANGVPQSAVLISLYSASERGRYLHMGSTNMNALSDDLGRYRIDSVPPGSYFLAATGKQDEVIWPTYFPSTGESQRAERITLAAGDRRSGLDLVLLQNEMATVFGSAGSASSQVNLRALGGAATNFWSTNSDSDGKFKFSDVPKGRYSLTSIEHPAKWTNNGTASAVPTRAGVLPMEILSSDAVRADIALKPLSRFRGSVEGDVTCGGLDILGLVPVEASWAETSPTVSIQGLKFESQYLPRGAYLVQLPSLSDDCDFSVTSSKGGGARIYLDADVDLVLKVERGDGAVRGIVFWQDAVKSRGFVFAVPEDPKRKVRLAVVSSEGAYQFAHLPRGPYRLIHQKTLAPHTVGSGQSIQVRGGSEEVVNLGETRK